LDMSVLSKSSHNVAGNVSSFGLVSGMEGYSPVASRQE